MKSTIISFALICFSLFLSVNFISAAESNVFIDSSSDSTVVASAETSAVPEAVNLFGTIKDENGEPLIGATLLWAGTDKGVITDLEGKFSISTTNQSDLLVVTYVGYKPDTIDISKLDITKAIELTMQQESVELETVTLTGRAASTVNSRVTAVQTTTIAGAELCKAACCNLSESFETNASVDVSYSDAATGAKTIKLLGLSGTYVQLLTENTPGVRGLAQNFGMEYIPGVWMESIQVSKGTSSVINGYEATTGQINVEYLKPQTSDPIAINGMVSSTARAEINATGGWNINDKWSTGVLAHYKNESVEHDSNKDGFMDLPKTQQANLLNRWYVKDGNYTGQILVRGLYDSRHGGQLSSYGENRYSIDLNTWRLDAFTKHGFVFNEEKGTSIGLIFAGSYHNQDNLYGVRKYHGDQGNFNFNGIFQTNFTDAHKLVAGLSLNFDNYRENMVEDTKEYNAALGAQSFVMDRAEWTPGVFAEYSYKYHEHLSLLAGVRADWSSRYGFFFTPRFNVRYSPWEWWNLRASVGMGYRSPNLFSDFANVLPSARRILGDVNNLNQERAVNAGISTTFYIPIAGRELQISADYYYTHFLETVIMDLDSDPHAVTFSNLDYKNGGRSYAGNFQVEASMEILRGWTMTLAYRMSDVKYTINGELVEKPLTNRFKALITTSYQTPLKHWQFDVTAQFNGGGRMPTPEKYADGTYSWNPEFPWHEQLMAQVTRYFRTWSIYVGAENMTNFTQKNPIIGADNPYSGNFDASMAWGPIHGWTVYAGFRWAINKK